MVLLTLRVVHFNCFSLVNRLSAPCIIRNICAWFPLIDTFVCKSRLRYWQASVISHSKAWRLMPTLITWPELPSALIKQTFIDLELGLGGGIKFDLNWNFIVFHYRRGSICQVLERSTVYYILFLLDERFQNRFHRSSEGFHSFSSWRVLCTF